MGARTSITQHSRWPQNKVEHRLFRGEAHTTANLLGVRVPGGFGAGGGGGPFLAGPVSERLVANGNEAQREYTLSERANDPAEAFNGAGMLSAVGDRERRQWAYAHAMRAICQRKTVFGRL